MRLLLIFIALIVGAYSSESKAASVCIEYQPAVVYQFADDLTFRVEPATACYSATSNGGSYSPNMNAVCQNFRQVSWHHPDHEQPPWNINRSPSVWGWDGSDCIYSPSVSGFTEFLRINPLTKFGYYFRDDNGECVENCPDEPEPQQCGENEVLNIFDECVCADGFSRNDLGVCAGEDEIDPDPDPDPDPEPSCDSSDSCLYEAQLICESQDNQVVYNYSWYEGDNYSLQCGYLAFDGCPSGTSWSAQEQLCITDSDNDGYPDPYDPSPENPDDPTEPPPTIPPDNDPENPRPPIIGGGNPPINVGGGGVPQDPIGETTNFNDTAIVAAINETIKQNNESNSLLESIKNSSSESNALLAENNQAIGNSTQAITDSINNLNDTLEPVDGTETNNQISELFNKSPDELGIETVNSSNAGFVSDAFTQFENSSCVNPVFGGHTLDLCKHSQRIVPVLEFLLWGLTLFFIYSEIHTVLRRGRD